MERAARILLGLLAEEGSEVGIVDYYLRWLLGFVSPFAFHFLVLGALLTLVGSLWLRRARRWGRWRAIPLVMKLSGLAMLACFLCWACTPGSPETAPITGPINRRIEQVMGETPQAKVGAFLDVLRRGDQAAALTMWPPNERLGPEFEERRHAVTRELSALGSELSYSILDIEWWRTCCEPGVIENPHDAGFARLRVAVGETVYIFDVLARMGYWGELEGYPVRRWRIIDVYPEGEAHLAFPWPLPTPTPGPPPLELTVEDVTIEVRPGVIELEGRIDLPLGTGLGAELWRDGKLWHWADLDTLHTTVGEDGRFTFVIRVAPGQPEALPPADYVAFIGSTDPTLGLHMPARIEWGTHTLTPMPKRVTVEPTQLPTPTVTPTPSQPTPIPVLSPTSTPEPTPTKAAKGLTITIVYDNNPCDERLKTAWGFSCLVERGDLTLLFDTGGDAETLLSNMATLGLDPATIDIIVLSHIHGDHVGGLDGLLAINERTTVYLPRSFPARFKEQVKAHACVVEVHEPMEIAEGIYTTGELGAGILEQSLVLVTGRGLVVITGCAHPGIVSIVKKAKEIAGGKVYLVMGGFHLGGASQAVIEGIVGDFRELGVQKVAPCHCSGDLARSIFERTYGEDFIRVGVGSRLEVSMMHEGSCVYAGSGAVLARDVEVALDRLALSYRRMDEQDIRAGGLEACSLLIVPGGYTAQCVDALGEEGFEQIREFIAGGGGYIGICAGAYIAARRVEVPGRPPGLGIIEIENQRRAGTGIRTISIVKPEHPVVRGYAGKVSIWYQNGPIMKAGQGVETLAVYDGGGDAIVCTTYGRGRVVIFSPHPEGSLEGGS
ncbi:MAG TPA: MBL fold metallo-hydrolase, partial [Anaerolineae bacterium]|nr:MBL fold metallo-hydrolase [Anaerolineae bacterium]